MLFSFQGSGAQAIAGIPAANAIVFSGAVPDGTTIRTRWGGQDYPIVFKTSPTEANELPAGNGSSAYVDTLVDYFESYFPFREAFEVSRLDFIYPQIVLTAKQPGPQFNLSAPKVIAGIDVSNAVGGADPKRKLDYSVYAELWVKRPDQDVFSRKQSFTIAVKDDGTAQLDVGSILHAEMLPDWPSWSFNQPSGAVNSHLQYYVAYGESFGAPQQIGKIYTDQVRDAYYGGADYLHRGGSGFSLTGFVVSNNNPGNDKALRLGSLTRYVREDEPQFLTFLNTRADAENVELEVQLVYSDGTDSIYSDRYAPTDWPKGSKLTYAVGVQQLQVPSHITAGKTLAEYRVRILSASQYYSAQYRYIISGVYEPWVRYFAYLNSFGGVDTLATFGKGSSELSRFYEQASRYLPAHYDVQLGQTALYDISLQLQLEVTTGWRTKSELKLWNDFYRSPYLFHMKATQALPIGIVSKSIKQGKDGDNQYAHSFEVQYLWKDDFYSDDEDQALLGDPLPPLSGGPVVPIEITQPTVVNNVDLTVPNVVRSIDEAKVAKWDQAFAWGSHAAQGYLTPATGAQIFFRKDQGIDWFQNITNKPTTRDAAGLSDVPTSAEVATKAASTALQQINNTINIRPFAVSWLEGDEPV